jgi:hypothetical protein
MDTLPPIPEQSPLQTPLLSTPLLPGTVVTTTPAPTTTTTPAPTGTPQRVELSYVEKMVIGVAITLAIIMLGILVAMATRS